ncbi:MAG: gliding motility lipoprotein GldH [Bacteroidales bacterium]|nr:gliding motility lipoprotein GldH [Bacteroidales bacterium]
MYIKNNNSYPLLISLILTLVLLFSSCDSDRVYEKNIKIPNSTWNRLEILKFNAEISDTTLNYNFYLNVRNNVDYEYSNLYVFLNTIMPSQSIVRDTVEIMLAGPDGKWLGKGWGKHKELYLQIGKNMKFPEMGTYAFEIEQAMRVDLLKNISNMGIRIEKANS